MIVAVPPRLGSSFRWRSLNSLEARQCVVKPRRTAILHLESNFPRDTAVELFATKVPRIAIILAKFFYHKLYSVTRKFSAVQYIFDKFYVFLY